MFKLKSTYKREERRANEEAQRAREADQKAREAVEEVTRIKQEAKERCRKEEKQREQFKWGPGSQLSWSEEECKKLRENFQEDLKNPESHTFLLFGPTSHGKSSVGNGFLAAIEDKDYVPKYYFVAQSVEHVSRGFKTKKYAVHRIIDMPGIFEGNAKSENIKKIVTGQVPWVSKITAVTLETHEQQKAPDSTVECIIIVLRYDCELSPELKRQINDIWKRCGEDVLSCHLVLTHLDVCDPQFKDTANLPKMYESPKVLKAVERMSKETGMPPCNISFVKNYTTEQKTDLNSKLQYLRILDIVKQSADEVAEARRTHASMTEEYREQNKNFLNRVLTYYEFLFFLGIIFIAILLVYFS